MSKTTLLVSALVLVLVGLVLWANLREVRVVIVDETQVLDEDQFWYDEFELRMNAEVKVSARLLNGVAVDVFLIDKQNYDDLQAMMAGKLSFAQLQFDYFDGLSHPELTGNYESGWEQFGPGTYYVIVDNSIFGVAVSPAAEVKGQVHFSVKVEARR